MRRRYARAPSKPSEHNAAGGVEWLTFSGVDVLVVGNESPSSSRVVGGVHSTLELSSTARRSGVSAWRATGAGPDDCTAEPEIVGVCPGGINGPADVDECKVLPACGAAVASSCKPMECAAAAAAPGVGGSEGGMIVGEVGHKWATGSTNASNPTPIKSIAAADGLGNWA